MTALATTKFRELIHRYCRAIDYKQEQLAEAVGLHPTAFSRKLNQTRGAAFSRPEVKSIIKNLAEKQAITNLVEALELLELAGMNRQSFSGEDWKTAPLSLLDASPTSPLSSKVEAIQTSSASFSRPQIDTRPSGLTFLFTDIESSTQLWEKFPKVMPDLLSFHDGLLYRLIERYSGHVLRR